MSKRNISSTNLSLPVPVFLIFLTLKLTEVIDWSWWFILMPLYIVPVGLVVLALIALALAGLVDVVTKKRFLPAGV